jgi:hypothetical protein
VAESGFLTAYEVVAKDRGWAVAAEVWHDEAKVGGVEPVDDGPPGYGAVGEAVEEYHGSAGWVAEVEVVDLNLRGVDRTGRRKFHAWLDAEIVMRSGTKNPHLRTKMWVIGRTDRSGV